MVRWDRSKPVDLANLVLLTAEDRSIGDQSLWVGGHGVMENALSEVVVATTEPFKLRSLMVQSALVWKRFPRGGPTALGRHEAHRVAAAGSFGWQGRGGPVVVPFPFQRKPQRKCLFVACLHIYTTGFSR